MTRYLFIDGHYLQTEYREAMLAFIGNEGDLDLISVKQEIGAFRVFYYDAIDTQRSPEESEEGFATRVRKKELLFNQIRSLHGFHLPEGTVSRSTKPRKRTQKEVDVLLAVDALTHSFNKNMDHVALLTGDLDFRPLVERLIYLGTYVELWYVPKSTTQELYWAVDVGQAITPVKFHQWSTRRFQQEYPIPQGLSSGKPPLDGYHQIKGLFRVLSGRRSQIEFPTVEVDGVDEVLLIAETARRGLDPLNP